MKFVRIFAELLALLVGVVNAYAISTMLYGEWNGDMFWSHGLAIVAALIFGVGASYLTVAEQV